MQQCGKYSAGSTLHPSGIHHQDYLIKKGYKNGARKIRGEREDMRKTETDEFLEKEFDFSKAVKNLYAKELKKQVTINLSPRVITYFKAESSETGIPYQTLINLYLLDCVKEKKKLDLTWK